MTTMNESLKAVYKAIGDSDQPVNAIVQVVQALNNAIKALVEEKFSTFESDRDLREEVEAAATSVFEWIETEDDTGDNPRYLEAKKAVCLADLQSDLIEDWHDQCAYNRDPYAYYGVSKSDFM